MPCGNRRCGPSPARPRRCRASFAARSASLMLAAVEEEVHPRLVIAGRDQWRRTDRAPCLSVSSDIASLRQASRTNRSALARSPRPIMTRASENLPLAEIGDSFSNHDQTIASSRWSSHSAASIRRRRKVCEGQLGLAAMESAVAFDGSAVVVAAQDDPFRKLSCQRIGDRRLGLGRVGRLVLAHEVDDVLQRFLVIGRGRGGRGHRRRHRRLAGGGGGNAACWRVAGAIAALGSVDVGTVPCGLEVVLAAALSAAFACSFWARRCGRSGAPWAREFCRALARGALVSLTPAIR